MQIKQRIAKLELQVTALQAVVSAIAARTATLVPANDRTPEEPPAVRPPHGASAKKAKGKA